MKRTIVLAMMLSSCINISLRVTPDKPEVPTPLEGRDCVPVVFGIGIGTATVEGAQNNTRPTLNAPDYFYGVAYRIRTVRHIQLSEYQILFFGMKCVEVSGQ